MEDEQQYLQDLVIQLRAQNGQLTQELSATQASLPSSISSSSGPFGSAGLPGAAPERLLYIPREWKCPMFRVNMDTGVVEWVEEVRASMPARHMAPIDQEYWTLFTNIWRGLTKL